MLPPLLAEISARAPKTVSQAKVVRQQQTRLTREEVEQVVAGFHSGASVRELAARFNCHRVTVASMLRDAGIQLGAVPLTNQQVDDAVRLYGTGLSLAQIATGLGCGPNTILTKLRQRTVAIRNRHGHSR